MSDDRLSRHPTAKRLNSEDLAALIVDALCDAGFVAKTDTPAAVTVAATEIEVRKALGDY
jgi:hypothetical protein